jgi:uncharacterized protein YjiS (DUF1127 family)
MMCGIINIQFHYGRGAHKYLSEAPLGELQWPMHVTVKAEWKPPFRPTTAVPLIGLFRFLARAGEVSRQRRALMRLGDQALKDFGATRADAWHEAGRPWWDLPDPDRR